MSVSFIGNMSKHRTHSQETGHSTVLIHRKHVTTQYSFIETGHNRDSNTGIMEGKGLICLMQ